MTVLIFLKFRKKTFLKKYVTAFLDKIKLEQFSVLLGISFPSPNVHRFYVLSFTAYLTQTHIEYVSWIFDKNS